MGHAGQFNLPSLSPPPIPTYLICCLQQRCQSRVELPNLLLVREIFLASSGAIVFDSLSLAFRLLLTAVEGESGGRKLELTQNQRTQTPPMAPSCPKLTMDPLSHL